MVEGQVLAENGTADRGTEPFRRTLSRNGLILERGNTTTLQINVGLLCNQTCRHCHLNAGPDRREVMDSATAEAVIDYAGRGGFEVIDVTGGAPELNPNIFLLIEKLHVLAPRLLIRSNLTVLNDGRREDLIRLLQERRVVIVASFPSLNEAQADAQRGALVFRRSIEALARLNAMGYGVEGTGLELNLVSNPPGAFLPTPQAQLEKRFREVLGRKWGIAFSHLYAFANAPLGRFREWLAASGNLAGYMERLTSNFNPCAVDGLMCRSLVSVSWDGYLYDCDFNVAADLPMGGRRIHLSEMTGRPGAGTPIAVGDHCYTCTAGAGFT
ncbi:MAG: arsenosugar biosynthesis radical SAM (seleno)protein ArsS [Thermodesulfobacteriota bacterium]